MTEVMLKQSGITMTFRLVLEPSAVAYSHSEVLSERKSIPYRQITGIFRDADRCYIVWGADVVHFLHQPEKTDYVTFVDQLLQRVRPSRGA
jgi:hypothetical protein